MLKCGADPNMVDNMQRMAMHHAVNVAETSADASFDLEQLLLNYGAKVNMRDSRGRTPLHYAFTKIGKPFESSQIDPIETVTSLCGLKDLETNVKGNNFKPLSLLYQHFPGR